MTENQTTHVESMWGSPILDEGFTNLPNLIIRNYVKVGLTPSEFCIINIILTFKHDTRDPHPSQETIARIFFGDKYKPENSERALRKHLKSIEDKGLMYVGFKNNEKGRSSSVYNFQPLIEAVLEAANVEVIQEQEQESITWKKDKKGKGKNASTGTKSSATTGTKSSEVPEQKVPQPQEQKVPTKKKSLKSKSKKTNKNKSQSVHEEISALEVSDKIKEYLTTKADGLTSHKLSVIESLYKKNLVADDQLFEDKLEKVFGYNPAPNAFKKYLETSLVNSKDEKKAAKQPNGRKTVRKELVPEFLEKLNQENDIEQAKQPGEEFTPEAIEKLRQELLELSAPAK